MIPSKYQKDFYDEVRKNQNNILVQACAGSGKTTSTVEALKLVPIYKKSIFLAFSKAIQEELSKRVPKHVDCLTLHSLGYRSISSYYKKQMKLDGYKTFKFSNNLVKELKNKDGKDLNAKEQMVYKFTVSDIIDMARITLNTSFEGFKYVEKNYDIVCKHNEVESAYSIFNELSQYNRVMSFKGDVFIDYVDMIFLPIQLNLDMPKYDYIFIDEVQDLNASQHELISKIMKPNSRVIAVGDYRQSIFGFSGALSNSMDIMKEKFNMKQLPLSITYRVPKTGVELLKQFNPDIECTEDAIDGTIKNGEIIEAELGDLIICRNTKPLIVAYFLLLAQEKKSTIVGKEMESGLNKIIHKYEDYSTKEALFAIEQDKLHLEFQLLEQGVEDPKKHYKYVQFEEKIDIIKIFFERYASVKIAKQKIHEIFDESKPGIKLMTVHRSKGLESNRVFFITHFENNKLIPSRFSISPEQKKQESNLEYVALSRHKKELIFVKL